VLRTAPLAVVVAAGLAGAAQLGAMSLARVLAGRAGTAPLAGAIEAAVGVHPGAIAPTLAAAGCGAAIAALLLSWADNRKPSVALIPGDMTPGGERRRRRGAVLAAIEARRRSRRFDAPRPMRVRRAAATASGHGKTAGASPSRAEARTASPPHSGHRPDSRVT